MKVGFVNFSQFVGGAEREILDNATAMQADHGISVVALIDVRNRDFSALLAAAGIAVIAADFDFHRIDKRSTKTPSNLWRVFAQARTLKMLQARHNIDLLITYSFHSGIVGALARLLGMRAKLVVGQVTRRDLTRGGLIEHLPFLAADAVTYNSQSLRRSYESMARRYAKPERIVYSYVKQPASRCRATARKELRTQLGLAPDTRIVGFFGHVFEPKRVPDLIEAVALLNASPDANYFLLVVGAAAAPTPYEAQVRALADAKCAGRNHFCGFVNEPFSLMAACDVIVLPSVEPFGRVLVEAMYLGVPFVGTDQAGPREIMDLADARCGRLVPPARPDLIAEAIRHLVQQPPAEPPRVPYPLTREGIIGGAIQFYRQVLAS